MASVSPVTGPAVPPSAAAGAAAGGGGGTSGPVRTGQGRAGAPVASAGAPLSAAAAAAATASAAAPLLTPAGPIGGGSRSGSGLDAKRAAVVSVVPSAPAPSAAPRAEVDVDDGSADAGRGDEKDPLLSNGGGGGGGAAAGVGLGSASVVRPRPLSRRDATGEASDDRPAPSAARGSDGKGPAAPTARAVDESASAVANGGTAVDGEARPTAAEETDAAEGEKKGWFNCSDKVKKCAWIVAAVVSFLLCAGGVISALNIVPNYLGGVIGASVVAGVSGLLFIGSLYKLYSMPKAPKADGEESGDELATGPASAAPADGEAGAANPAVESGNGRGPARAGQQQ